MILRKKRPGYDWGRKASRAAVLALVCVLLAVPTARSQSMLRHPFAIQVNASEDAAMIAGRLDSLQQRGVPAYRTETTGSGGSTFHRLRIGPFPDRAAARTFARFQGYTDPWIVPAGEDRSAFQQVVGRVARDVVPLRPRPPRFYLGRTHSFAALLMPAPGPASGARPATMRLYTPAGGKPDRVENVTGLREADSTLEFGQAERVFIKKTDAPVEDFSDEIETFSRAHDLSKYLVRQQMALYDEDRMARFTLLGIYDLSDGETQIYSQPGFDYVDRRGETVRRQGSVSQVQAQQMGNAAARAFNTEAPTQDSTPRVALFAHPTARGENVKVLLLFFAERGS